MCHFRATHTYLMRSLVASERSKIPNLSLNVSISKVPILTLRDSENSDVGVCKAYCTDSLEIEKEKRRPTAIV